MGIKAGVIVTDGKFILGCHPTGRTNLQNGFDIPKGFQSLFGDETLRETAERELREETGIVDAPLEYVNTFKYRNGTLAIFEARMSLPPLSQLVCISNCIKNFRIYPEMDYFKYFSISSIPFVFYGGIVPILLYCLRKEYFSQSLDITN